MVFFRVLSLPGLVLCKNTMSEIKDGHGIQWSLPGFRYVALCRRGRHISLSVLQWRLRRDIQPELISILVIAGYAPEQEIDLPGFRKRLQDRLKGRRCGLSSGIHCRG